jgi:transposase
MLANVQQATIALGTTVYTDEYDIYSRLPAWGYTRKSVNHSQGEYARDEDDDGSCEVHVNTIEGFCSLLRSWLRPHRGIPQEKLPLYLSFFEFDETYIKVDGRWCYALASLAKPGVTPVTARAERKNPPTHAQTAPPVFSALGIDPLN